MNIKKNKRDNSTPRTPLVVDLDGTLIKTDLLLEGIIQYIKSYPFQVYRIFWWFFKGGIKKLKHDLFKHVNIDVSTLPYNKAVLEYLKKNRGRKVILATGSIKMIAEQIAESLSLFDDVFSSNKKLNLTGKNKRDFLISKYGEKGFDYVGNSIADLPVWHAANRSYAVNLPLLSSNKITSEIQFEKILSKKNIRIQTILKAIRIHQWLKNILILVPLFAAHKYHDIGIVFDGVVAFLSFSFCASSVYILNDLFDLPSDRRHRQKRNRPFASGDLDIIHGICTFIFFILLSFSIGLTYLNDNYVLGLSFYFTLTLYYSLKLKSLLIIDIITLASLYTIRLFVGSLAMEIELSFWMLLFSIFFFLSLALLKRYSELFHLKFSEKNDIVKGRAYLKNDFLMLGSLGASSGYLSVLVLGLYIDDLKSAYLYNNGEFLWFLVPLMLAWISRVWLLANRGLVDEDPVQFASRDTYSILNAFLLILIVFIAR